MTLLERFQAILSAALLIALTLALIAYTGFIIFRYVAPREYAKISCNSGVRSVSVQSMRGNQFFDCEVLKNE